MWCRNRWLLAIVTWSVGCSLAGAADPSPQEDALKQKGVVVNGGTLGLEEEAVLKKLLLEDNALSRTYTTARQARIKALAQISSAQQAVDALEKESTAIRTYMNNNVLEISEAEGLLIKLSKTEDALRTGSVSLQGGTLFILGRDTKEAVEKAREEYDKHLEETHALVDKLTKQYTELAADADVQKLIEQINQAQSKTLKLVESADFKGNKKKLQVMEATLANFDKLDGKSSK